MRGYLDVLKLPLGVLDGYLVRLCPVGVELQSQSPECGVHFFGRSIRLHAQYPTGRISVHRLMNPIRGKNNQNKNALGPSRVPE